MTGNRPALQLRRPFLFGNQLDGAGPRRFVSWLLGLQPWRVVAVFVVAQWVLVLGIAADVRHNGWIYYQGGDQLWYYTTAWLFGHGSFTQPLVGYLWSILLAPIALVGGPNLAQSLPAIVIVNVAVLMPIALVALYGLARLIAGRLFAYWTLLLWIVVPLVAIWYTNTGYHQRFTEILLPQGLGLTAMADFPTMVAVLVAAYFCARIVFDHEPRLLDAAAAGVATGAAIGLKPSAVLFVAGPPLAVVLVRRWRHTAVLVGSVLPAVVALSVWKWRGYGYLPLLHSLPAPSQALAAGPDVVAVNVPYFHFDWHHFTTQLDLLREHFWSGRLIEWFVIAGSIGIALYSRRAFVLVVGWFFAFVIVKAGTSGAGTTSIEDTNLLRILMPAYPAFLLLLASLPFLFPRLARRAASSVAPSPPRRLSSRAALTGVLAGALGTALVPLGVIAAASPVHGPSPSAAAVQQPPLPTGVDLGVRARQTAQGVALRWKPQRPAGGAVFYHVFRTPADEDAFSCPGTVAAPKCLLQATDLGTTRTPAFVDRKAGAGRYVYRVGVAANWLDNPQYGDVYVLSGPVTP